MGIECSGTYTEIAIVYCINLLPILREYFYDNKSSVPNMRTVVVNYQNTTLNSLKNIKLSSYFSRYNNILLKACKSTVIVAHAVLA